METYWTYKINSLIVGRLFNLMHVIQADPGLAIRQFSVFTCFITIRIMKVNMVRLNFIYIIFND